MFDTVHPWQLWWEQTLTLDGMFLWNKILTSGRLCCRLEEERKNLGTMRKKSFRSATKLRMFGSRKSVLPARHVRQEIGFTIDITIGVGIKLLGGIDNEFQYWNLKCNLLLTFQNMFFGKYCLILESYVSKFPTYPVWSYVLKMSNLT